MLNKIHDVPIRAGVYILRNYGKVVWVGQGLCALAKIYAHLTNKGITSPFHRLAFDSAQVIPCRVDQLDELHRRTCIELNWNAPKIPGASVSQLSDLMRTSTEALSTLHRRA